MNAKQYVEDLRAESFAQVFNPYADRCAVHDARRAEATRARTLARLLVVASAREIDALWLGRDLGWRGGRRTGLALTDDAHREAHLARFGLAAPRPTRGPLMAERTAEVVWSSLARADGSFFLWNVFPLHPHLPGAPFSNRPHGARERDAGEAYLNELIFLLRPRRVVALGAEAAHSAARVAPRLPVVQIRHPSYGGQRLFLAQVAALARDAP
ncbi:MAG TPA: uracil-DNA glycosylase [Methylocystis sp.]|nr:uracil-DNA glycosylase [Methylocystis sp.]